jgi:hypothetical protein
MPVRKLALGEPQVMEVMGRAGPGLHPFSQRDITKKDYGAKLRSWKRAHYSATEAAWQSAKNSTKQRSTGKKP